MAIAQTKKPTTTLQVKRFTPSEKPTNDYFTDEKGIWAWMTTVDHKKIGLMYLVSVAIFFAIAGFLAVALRTELWTPAKTFIEADTYNQLFTVHGALMVFFVLIPSIPAALGNFVLPMQLGAKDVAFPKLNLASFYIYVVGAIFTFIALVAGGFDTGWTFYTPYSSDTNAAGVIWVTLGVFILGFSSILTGTNFITTIHKLRAPGITWDRLPLNIWALYATSIIQVLATPVLAITILLLAFENIMDIGIFDPAMGGDPVLFQHFFWFYSHPAVYIMIVPGFGIISEVI
ncbi:MAG: cbb3-type cytochrome c oxidase subunit I, partial [Balneolales bacterium]|nr:cbb3-type cytochrome c oxidase subunit I [Balneolales bacterium]